MSFDMSRLPPAPEGWEWRIAQADWLKLDTLNSQVWKNRLMVGLIETNASLYSTGVLHRSRTELARRSDASVIRAAHKVLEKIARAKAKDLKAEAKRLKREADGRAAQQRREAELAKAKAEAEAAATRELNRPWVS